MGSADRYEVYHAVRTATERGIFLNQESKSERLVAKNYDYIFIQVKAQASVKRQCSWNTKQHAQGHWGQHEHVAGSTEI